MCRTILDKLKDPKITEDNDKDDRVMGSKHRQMVCVMSAHLNIRSYC